MEIMPENQKDLTDEIDALCLKLAQNLGLEGGWVPMIQLHSVERPGVVALYCERKERAAMAILGASACLDHTDSHPLTRMLRVAQAAVRMALNDVTAQVIIVARDGGNESVFRCDALDGARPRESVTLLQHALTSVREQENQEAATAEAAKQAN